MAQQVFLSPGSYRTGFPGGVEGGYLSFSLYIERPMELPAPQLAIQEEVLPPAEYQRRVDDAERKGVRVSGVFLSAEILRFNLCGVF